MLIGYKRGQTGIVLRVKILDSLATTGAGKTGLTNASSSLNIAAIADNESSPVSYSSSLAAIDSIATLGTYAAPASGRCRFREVNSFNHPGVYEIQLANSRYAVTGAKSLLVSISGPSGMAETDVVIPLRDLDPYDGVSGGLSRLDAAVGSVPSALLTTANAGAYLSETVGRQLQWASAYSASADSKLSEARLAVLDDLDAMIQTQVFTAAALANAAVDLSAVEDQLDAIQAKTDLIGTGAGAVVNNAGITDAGEIVIRKASTWNPTIEVGEDLSAADQVWFTLKRSTGRTDEQSLVQISLTDGLLYLDGEPATDSSLGSIEIEVTAEAVTIRLDEEATAELCPSENCVWDIKKLVGGDAFSVVEGTGSIVATVTRATV